MEMRPGSITGPQWVKGKGWTPAKELKAGDVLVGGENEETPVEDILATGQTETVYNFRVADHHTYFVGGPEWNFAVWAHNACVIARPKMDNNPVSGNGKTIDIRGKAQNTTHTPGDVHAGKVDQLAVQQANSLINDPTVKQGYVVMNRSIRTAVGGGPGGPALLNAPSATVNPNLRPDVTVVYQTNDGIWHVRAFEVASPGQSRGFLDNQLLRAKAALRLGPNFVWDNIGLAAVIPYP
jgi:hypothetical protein